MTTLEIVLLVVSVIQAALLFASVYFIVWHEKQGIAYITFLQEQIRSGQGQRATSSRTPGQGESA